MVLMVLKRVHFDPFIISHDSNDTNFSLNFSLLSNENVHQQHHLITFAIRYLHNSVRHLITWLKPYPHKSNQWYQHQISHCLSFQTKVKIKFQSYATVGKTAMKGFQLLKEASARSHDARCCFHSSPFGKVLGTPIRDFSKFTDSFVAWCWHIIIHQPLDSLEGEYLVTSYHQTSPAKNFLFSCQPSRKNSNVKAWLCLVRIISLGDIFIRRLPGHFTDLGC